MAASHAAAACGDCGSRSALAAPASSTALARRSKSLCRVSVRGRGDAPTIARKFICTPNIGRVYFLSTDRAKHLRPIRLESWQQGLVKDAPEEFVRGRIDSDGCRVVANDRGVKSVRYHFSNRSEDIRGLFCATLDDLAISWTRPSKYHVAVYRKAAVARLDEFVGPKA